MKNKSGFTLSEVLITMGIVGIISAFTIPRFINNAQERAIQPTVEHSVSMLQQGMANIIQTAQFKANATTLAAITVDDVLKNGESKYLTEKSGNDEVLFDTLGSILGIEPIDNYSDIAGAGSKTYKLKKGRACIIVRPINNNDIADDIANDAILTDIYVDANCSKNPNALNEDIFLYGLSNNGSIIKSTNASYTNKKIF